jgi:hypothetical protein
MGQIQGAGLPTLSVVLIVDAQRERGGWALAAVLSQKLSGRLEVLLFDFGHAEHPPLAGSDHRDVRVIPARRGTGCGETMAAAVSATRAPVIAFIEEHVVVLEGWAEAIQRAHEGPWAAVCAEVHPGDTADAVSRRIELVSRNVWSAPAHRGDTPVLRWRNVSYKRNVLLGYQPHLRRLLESEDALFRRLRADGHRLAVEPDARIVHAHESSWSNFLAGSVQASRLATAAALEVGGRRLPSTVRAVVAALAGPVRWPFVLLRRTRNLPDSDVWLPVLYASWPYVLQYYLCVAVAALVGALAGAGDSSVRFQDSEINHPRRRPVTAPLIR